MEFRYGKKRAARLCAMLPFVFLLLCAVPSLAPASAFAAVPDAPFGAMLSWTDDPATSITVTWRDVAGATDARVRYGSAPDLTLSVAAEAVPNRSGAEVTGTRFTATLRGLLPETRYLYRVESSSGAGETSAFTTPEADAERFFFLYFGDIQVARDAETDYAAFGDLARAALAKNPGAAFALQGGDIVESGVDARQWDAFLTNASASFSKLPFLPANGNHESNFLSGKPELYLETFALPRNGPKGFEEEFYSFDYGDAHVSVLNAWVFSGEQKLTEEELAAIDRWLARDLLTARAKWKIAVMHLPPYPVHGDVNADRTRAHWAELFESFGVTLTLVGHQQVYSRLKPLTGGAVDYEDGVTQIMGNAGLKFYDSADESLAERTIYNTATYQLVGVDGDSMTVQCFDGDGNELDFAVLAARERTHTRGAFAELLWQSCGAPAADPAASEAAFSDVPPGSAFAVAVAWAYENGIMKGYGNGAFGASDVMRGVQIDAVRERLNGLNGFDCTDLGEMQ